MRFGFRELIFFAVLLAVPVMSLFYVFKPRNGEIESALREIDVKRGRLANLAEITSKIDDLELMIMEGRESIKLVVEKLPSEKAVDDILKQVWQIADGNMLAVKSIKSEKTVPAAEYMELPLRMSLEGEFDGFYRFLLELEALSRITRIHELKIRRMVPQRTGHNAEFRPGTMRADFILSIYYEPESQSTSRSAG
ncbi:MAG: type 4a pilus biogenesis protein PilO [Phycisphaeraceae bacterium]|nr:type 4a pilus biogenesis protein PilO [Phycisphaeraceae bacterium]